MSPEVFAKLISVAVEIVICLMFVGFATGVIPLRARKPGYESWIQKNKWVFWIGALAAGGLAIMKLLR
jgi:hypothetical protein